MKKPKKKSSLKITLALIGSMALVNCGEDGYRNMYNSRNDCIAENRPEDCEMISSDSYDSSGPDSKVRYYGPFVPLALMAQKSKMSKAAGIKSVSRGGFGGSSFAHGSGRS